MEDMDAKDLPCGRELMMMMIYIYIQGVQKKKTPFIFGYIFFISAPNVTKLGTFLERTYF